MNAEACPICQKGEDVRNLGRPYAQVDCTQYDCRRCGTFAITGPAWYELQALNDAHRAPLASYTRQRSLKRLEVIMITTSDFKEPYSPYPIPYITVGDAISQFPKKISERLDHGLINLKYMSPYAGATFTIDFLRDAALLYAESFETKAASFMINILNQSGFIEFSGIEWCITAKGWNHIYKIESRQPDSNIGFIAMAFHPKFNPIWQAIEAGISKAGFTPFRVNQSETNGKICDEIIAQIQRSKFVVADFTDQRNGVYFEAGYAMGLGIPVIWSCAKKEVESGQLHFDTRQYNHIDWEATEELTARLYNRIRATIV